MELIDLVYSFVKLIANTTLLRWLTTLLDYLTVTLTVLLLGFTVFFFLTLDGFQWLFLHRKFWSCCLSFHWLSVADWDSFCYHWRDVLWEDIFELGASTVGGKFLSEFRLELIYIFLIVMVRATRLHGFQLLVLLS